MMYLLNKKTIACFLCLVLLLLPALALSSAPDFVSMTDEQLMELNAQLADELAVRGLFVYVSLSGSKYHTNPTCSKMKASMGVSVADAEGCGYEPCGRCCK